MPQLTNESRSVPVSPSYFFLMQSYTSLSVALLGALALIAPSGYSIGAAMLVLGSVVLLFRRTTLALGQQDVYVIIALLAYTLIGVYEAWWDEQGLRGVDKPIRFALAVPAMLLVMAYPPRLSWLWSGLALGAIGAGSWAGWQKLVEGAWRAQGHTYVIQFGNLSMLLGVLCLAGLGWAVAQPRHRLVWLVFLGLGAFFGILGSLFSGSRGGWVGFPFILLVLYRGYGRHLPRLAKITILSLLVISVSLIYVLPQTGVQARVSDAFTDIERYLSGESRTSSVGARFEMWQGAIHLIREKPITGWGENAYRQEMQSLGDEGVIDPGVAKYGHAHNEFIDAWAKRGIAGLVVLIVLYLVPMKLFARHLQAPNLQLRSLAVAGVMLSVAYIDFGLTQVFLAHNSGVMMYAFWLTVFYGALRALKHGGLEVYNK